MGKYDEAIALYRDKKMKRDEICKKYNLIKNRLTVEIIKNGLALWDRERMKVQRDEILRAYKSKKLSRKEILNRYNITKEYLNIIISKAGIELWDRQGNNKGRKKRKNNSKYFSWLEFRDNLILNYNKG